MNTYTFTVKRTTVGSMLILADTMQEAISAYSGALKKAHHCDDTAVKFDDCFIEGSVLQNEYELIDMEGI